MPSRVRFQSAAVLAAARELVPYLVEADQIGMTVGGIGKCLARLFDLAVEGGLVDPAQQVDQVILTAIVI